MKIAVIGATGYVGNASKVFQVQNIVVVSTYE